MSELEEYINRYKEIKNEKRLQAKAQKDLTNQLAKGKEKSRKEFETVYYEVLKNDIKQIEKQVGELVKFKIYKLANTDDGGRVGKIKLTPLEKSPYKDIFIATTLSYINGQPKVFVDISAKDQGEGYQSQPVAGELSDLNRIPWETYFTILLKKVLPFE